MAGNIIGVVAQRLIRAFACTARPYQAESTSCACSASPSETPRPVIYRPCGCERCDFQGYRGRLAIMELLRINGDMDELIARRATAREMRPSWPTTWASARSPTTACGALLDGSTSIEELGRVVDLTDRM